MRELRPARLLLRHLLVLDSSAVGENPTLMRAAAAAVASNDFKIWHSQSPLKNSVTGKLSSVCPTAAFVYSPAAPRRCRSQRVAKIIRRARRGKHDGSGGGGCNVVVGALRSGVPGTLSRSPACVRRSSPASAAGATCDHGGGACAPAASAMAKARISSPARIALGWLKLDLLVGPGIGVEFHQQRRRPTPR